MKPNRTTGGFNRYEEYEHKGPWRNNGNDVTVAAASNVNRIITVVILKVVKCKSS